MNEVFLDCQYNKFDEHRILEVPATFELHEAAVLMSDDVDQLILCTHNSTYAVRKVEYSNTLLISKKRQRSGEVVWQERCTRIFEVANCRPRCETVLKQLRETYLTLDELDGVTQNGKLYAFDELASRCPSSTNELIQILQDEGAVVVDGYVRLLHPSIVAQALHSVIMHIESHLTAVFQDGVVHWGAVETSFIPSVYPKIVLDVVRSRVSLSASASQISLIANKTLLILAQGACETLADPLSQDKLNWVSWAAFSDVWRGRIPFQLFGNEIAQLSGGQEPMLALSKLLRGHAIIGSPPGSLEKKIAWCTHNTLPTRLDERINLLLTSTASKWEALDLKAFVEPILEPGNSFEASVAKYCKEHRSPGCPVMYSLFSYFRIYLACAHHLYLIFDTYFFAF